MTAGGGVSVGAISSKNDNTTQDNIKLIGGGNINHYYLLDEKEKVVTGLRVEIERTIIIY